MITLALVMVGFSLEAQYFGRNKPNYETFEFEVLRSPHFTLYHYLRNEALAGQFLGQAEEWYSLHQHVLRDTIKESNPIVLFGNHADFQQTNTIGGNIGVGTGGVTEAFKNRVVMPIAMSNQQTHHVLGHELVHAFQYNMILNGDSTSMRNLGNLPLWMIEGLAEYLSIGGVDAHTAMWMRDAVLHDDDNNANHHHDGNHGHGHGNGCHHGRPKEKPPRPPPVGRDTSAVSTLREDKEGVLYAS